MSPADSRQQVRVLLVDQSDGVRQRLKTALATNPYTVVVGTARTPYEAGVLLHTCHPDVAVLDIQAGDLSSIHLCRTIRKSYPQIAVLFFTASDDHRLLKSAILAGAQGYLLKQASGEAVAKAIEVVAAGQAVVDQQLTPELLKWVRERTGPAQRTRSSRCSASDMRVLSLIAAGKTNKEIARHLNVTPGVFRARLLKIYKRLGISRRSAAASYFTRWEHGGL
ncbi:MAG: response regulator transcription factor [Nitrospira sp.]|nr:response regulator transcription factor [Nitrospira sp.]MDH4244901.1 response regulator transcription factor [Nitrospira sp.]MDH4357366.1 response regulator transcription factor [Nitrospira sp.]MDH5319619.1 response regulator transcription factor [Nitrospira sp.]